MRTGNGRILYAVGRWVVLWAPVCATVAAIVYVDILNHKTTQLERLNAEGLDKLAHAGAFGALTFFLCRAVLYSFPGAVFEKVLGGAVALVVLFSYGSETLQARVLAGHEQAPHMTANLTGVAVALVGVAAFHYLHLRRRDRTERRQAIQWARQRGEATRARRRRSRPTR